MWVRLSSPSAAFCPGLLSERMAGVCHLAQLLHFLNTYTTTPWKNRNLRSYIRANTVNEICQVKLVNRTLNEVNTKLVRKI